MRLLLAVALVLAPVSVAASDNSLIPQSTPTEQIELIQVVEKLALLQPEVTVQVCNL